MNKIFILKLPPRAGYEIRIFRAIRLSIRARLKGLRSRAVRLIGRTFVLNQRDRFAHATVAAGGREGRLGDGCPDNRGQRSRRIDGFAHLPPNRFRSGDWTYYWPNVKRRSDAADCGRSSRNVVPCTAPEAADRPPLWRTLVCQGPSSKRLSYSSRHATRERAVIKKVTN